MSAKLAPNGTPRGDTRATARYPCEVQTTCQPPSAWAKDPWPAVIRNIGQAGLSLTLSRRFERGSGLAIELPADDGTTSTVLARVIHVSPYPEGGWLLGVSFISELSDDEVGQVLHLSSLRQATLEQDAPAPAPSSVSGVLFQARLPDGELLRWFVKRLDHPGQWPLPPGKVMGLRFDRSSLSLTVTRCQMFGAYWVIDCVLSRRPDAPTLARLTGAED
ncbi:MAG: hypothetical protein ACRC33_12400 [Gemmataceae bacterium]